MPQFPDPDEKHAIAEKCRRCDALVESRNCISWGNGPLDADLVVVGEAPGEGVEPRSTESASGDEPRAGDPDAERWRGGNYTGMAYTNRNSGRKIRDLLADAGFGHEDCFFTNAVKCHPPENRDPTGAELDDCRPHLREEIRIVAPRAVVTTGKHATQSVLAGDGIELDGFLDGVLDPKRCPSLETTVVPLLHPSYQEVWLVRLGYDRDEYVDAIRTTLRELDAGG